MDSSSKSIINNSLITLIARLLAISVGFFTVPIFLTHLGNVGFGLWEIILVISYVPLIFISSLIQTLTWRFSMLSGSVDFNKSSMLFWISFFIVSMFFLIFVPLTYLLLPLLSHLLKIPNAQAQNFNISLILVVSVSILIGFQDIIGAWISGKQKSGVAFLYKTFSTVIGQISMIVFLKFKLGFLSMPLGLIVTFIIGFVIHLIWIINNREGLVAYKGLVSYNYNTFLKPENSIMKNYYLLTFVGSVILLFRTHSPKIFFAAENSTELLTNFSIASRLSGFLFIA
jgi:O-antigen/teichoic acid export membrane protein